MKYENQNEQYRRGSWAGDGSEEQPTRQTMRWTERHLKKPLIDPVSPYPSENARQFVRATRKDQRLARQMQDGLNKLEIREAEERYRRSLDTE